MQVELRTLKIKLEKKFFKSVAAFLMSVVVKDFNMSTVLRCFHSSIPRIDYGKETAIGVHVVGSYHFYVHGEAVHAAVHLSQNSYDLLVSY